MTRQLYDAVTPANIPADAQMVAGYCDGHYRWSDADWARFPHAVKVRVAVLATSDDGHVLDCESGDATPAQCPGWVQMRRAGGADPTVYCSAATWPLVKAAFGVARVAEPHYWIAAYPGNGANLYPGAVAHQYEDHLNLYDISVVADHWPGVDPPPAPPAAVAASAPPSPPPPPPPEEDTLQAVKFAWTNPKTGTEALYISDGFRYQWMSTATEVNDRANVLASVSGKPVVAWSGGAPVGDIRAFGRPDDAETAAMAGVAFP